MRKYYIGAAVLLLLGAWLLLKPTIVEEKALLSGQIIWVVEKGTEVEQGSELVRIRTLTGGEIAAARASARGLVQEVFVRVGDQLGKGGVVVKLEKLAK